MLIFTVLHGGFNILCASNSFIWEGLLKILLVGNIVGQNRPRLPQCHPTKTVTESW